MPVLLLTTRATRTHLFFYTLGRTHARTHLLSVYYHLAIAIVVYIKKSAHRQQLIAVCHGEKWPMIMEKCVLREFVETTFRLERGSHVHFFFSFEQMRQKMKITSFYFV